MSTIGHSFGSIRVFVSYAHEDDAYCRELIKTLADWQREQVIDIWTDHKLVPGDNWDENIRRQVDAADLILFLVSRSSIASEYIDRSEFQRALERHNRGEARLVPVIVRRCDWKKLGALQALPPGGTPISKYADPDDAWYDVRTGLTQVIETIRGVESRKPASTWASKGLSGLPENVTKLCDRTRQEAAFVDFYEDMRKARPGATQLFVVIEDDLDRPDFLVDRLYELRVAPLAVKTRGERRGSCLRATGMEYAYGSLPSLQRSAERNLFESLGLEVPEPASPQGLLTNADLSLHSHILVDQTVDGEKLAADADKLVDWFMNEFWANAVGSRTQWLVFLVFRFSSLDPRNARLREDVLTKLNRLFASDGRANTTPTTLGAPCLLLPQPDVIEVAHVADVLARFPIDSVRERNRLAQEVYADLLRTGEPRMDDVYQRLEQLRHKYLQTGTFQI